MRSFFLAVGYCAGLLLAAVGVMAIVDARSSPTTDVGAMVTGVEAMVGIGALAMGVGLLVLCGVVEYASRKSRPPD